MSENILNLLRNLPLQELVDVVTVALKQRDEASKYVRSGMRMARFVYDLDDEEIIVDLIGVADWRDIEEDEVDQFKGHFIESLGQCGTCANCGAEIVSYSKSAVCPVCENNVGCT